MMKKSERIELVCSESVAQDAQNRIRTTGIKGLDHKRAEELGVFLRISTLLCAMHTTIMSAYRIYSGVQYIINDLGLRKKDIAKAMNDFEKGYDKFIDFWTGYYSHGKAGVEVGEEMEVLYHNIMRWMQIPEEWALGDEQKLSDDTDVVLDVSVPNTDNVLRFYKSVINEEVLETDESWCVTKYDNRTRKQTCVEKNLDKSSATMVAKRMSDNDKDNIYTVSQMLLLSKNETIITPLKAFANNECISKPKHMLK